MNDGKFKNLEGHGKPLDLDDNSTIPEELRMSYKILKNAGIVPKEIEMNAEIKRLEDMVDVATDESSKFKALKKLEFLKKKILKTKGPTAIFNIPEDYEEKVVETVEKPSTNRK